MAIRDDVVVDFESSPRIITVLAPSTEITIQDLHDTLRAIEARPYALSYPTLIRSSGKDSLGGAEYVGITARLLNAQLAFEERAGPDFVQCTVRGGNLVAEDAGGNSISPIYTTSYTQVVYAQSTSPTLLNYTEILDLLGLSGENVAWSNITHDSNGNLTAARITQYTDNTLSVVRKQWDITASYNASNELLSYQMVAV